MTVTATQAPNTRTPHPFRQFILKLHGRCDLACDYCYVYTLADQRWRERPSAMSREIMRTAAVRIAEHANRHELRHVDIVLHGGEPLLAGTADIEYCVTTLRNELGAEVEATIQLQTNGVLLSLDFLQLFQRLGIRVGVSLDGDATAHDRHRKRANGFGSHELVENAVRLLASPHYRTLFGGLLCTIDLRNDPVRTYTALLEFAPPMVDFLLPHGNWSNPPPGRIPGSAATPYADWLIAVFDRWYHAPRQETRIRLFEEIINVLLGRPSGVESIGLQPSVVVVVETDGAIEASGKLASAYQGASATGLSVRHNAFDHALELPVFRSQQSGFDALAPACRSCRLRRVCGGGLFPHRYRRETGFRNPSVYCSDLYRLIAHIRDTLRADLAALRKPSS